MVLSKSSIRFLYDSLCLAVDNAHFCPLPTMEPLDGRNYSMRTLSQCVCVVIVLFNNNNGSLVKQQKETRKGIEETQSKATTESE